MSDLIKRSMQSQAFYLTLYSLGLRLREANIPIRHVQKILGHKTLQSTMVYLHVTTQAQVDSNDKVSKFMQGLLS